MPHCQKENHNRAAKSKAEIQRKKEAAIARKKAAKEKELQEELERQKLAPNNIGLADGFGEYEIGCEEEKEYVAHVNLKKRSKKHLRMDIRKREEKRLREEEERRRQEEEEKQKQEQNQMEGKEQLEEEDEEEPITQEFLVYICQCCLKKFHTTNQFLNHSKSKRHIENAKIFEEAGIIVTDVQLRGNQILDDEGNDDYSYEEYFEGDEESDEDNYDYEDDQSYQQGDESDAESDEEYNEPKKASLFSALAAAFSDSSSSSSEESEVESENEGLEENKEEEEDISNRNLKTENTVDDEEYDDEDDLELLEEIIYQNRLQERLYPSDDEDDDKKESDIVPIPFDDEDFDVSHLDTNEKRLAVVQRRLQKRLAARGIEPLYRESNAVALGKTLLQQVMDANIETLQARLEEYQRHKAEHQLLGREFRFAKGNSKALASQYTFRIDPADNPRARANVHHAGSHYHMQMSRSMQFGRAKGLMARHSAQGARLQASRMAAKEMAQMQQGSGMKIGKKTSKKSVQKRRGQAGGSKKTGGMSLNE